MAFSYSRLTGEGSAEEKILARDCMPAFRTGYIRLGPEKVVLTEYYLKFSERIRKLDVREDDVWVVSHPKTGTTWTQEMVWCIANDLDFERAKQHLPLRFPFLELSTLFDLTRIVPPNSDIEISPLERDSVQYVTDQKYPRFIKTHLPWSLLPQQIQSGTKQPKIIYVCRNAKDTCLSYYNHSLIFEGYKGNFEDFSTLFLGDSMIFGPFWSHVLGFWERRHQPNILFLKYEDLKKDLPAVIRQTTHFLDKTITDEQVAILADHLSFESMKNNESVNYEINIERCRQLGISNENLHFMRSGKVGDWKGKMSSELIQKFDKWTKDNLEETGLEFLDGSN